MGKLGKLLSGFAVLGVLFAWATNYKTPEGFEEPWKLKIFFMFARSASKFVPIFEYLGYEIPKNSSSNTIIPASITKEEKFLSGVRTAIYRPVGASGDLPAMVYYHGGGWVFGSPEMMEDFTNALVEDLGIVVISVDYRLAPKHPYPAAFEDCYNVAEHVMNNAAQLKVDPNRISLGGDSAGGNLAAAVSTKFRDEGKANKIKMQLLLYPAVQSLDYHTSSYEINKDDGLIPRENVAQFWSKYLFGNTEFVNDLIQNAHVSDEDRKAFASLCGNSQLLTHHSSKVNENVQAKYKSLATDPYLNPLVAKELSGMPQTVIIAPEQDVLLDEGFIYAQRLRASGNVVVYHNMKYSLHGIFSFKFLFPLSYQRAYEEILPYVKKFVV